MRLVIEDATPEVLAKVLAATDGATVTISAATNGHAKPRAPKPKPKAPAKPKSDGKLRCKCGESYSYRKSFENHLLVNNDPDHGEVFA